MDIRDPRNNKCFICNKKADWHLALENEFVCNECIKARRAANKRWAEENNKPYAKYLR